MWVLLWGSKIDCCRLADILTAKHALPTATSLWPSDSDILYGCVTTPVCYRVYGGKNGSNRITKPPALTSRPTSYRLCVCVCIHTHTYTHIYINTHIPHTHMCVCGMCVEGTICHVCHAQPLMWNSIRTFWTEFLTLSNGFLNCVWAGIAQSV